MELSLENRLICCGIEEGLADIIEAGLDHTLKIERKKGGGGYYADPRLLININTHVVLLLEMKSDSVSDESIYKLYSKINKRIAELQDRQTSGLNLRMGLLELSRPPTLTS